MTRNLVSWSVKCSIVIILIPNLSLADQLRLHATTLKAYSARWRLVLQKATAFYAANLAVFATAKLKQRRVYQRAVSRSDALHTSCRLGIQQQQFPKASASVLSAHSGLTVVSRQSTWTIARWPMCEHSLRYHRTFYELCSEQWVVDWFPMKGSWVRIRG